MTTSINNYKIYCTSENTYVSGWGPNPPTQCYSNNTHSVNVNSVQLISSVVSNEVKIKEDTIPVSRNIRIVQIALENIAPGEEKIVDYVFPINMSMYLFEYTTSEVNIPDELTIQANPNTVLGLIGGNIEIGSTTFIGPPALILYGVPGFYITITNGTNTNILGEIINIDKATNIVTVDTPTENAFLAANTLVKMTVMILNKLVIGQASNYKYGDAIIGGAAIPQGTLTRYIYKNNSVSGPPASLYLLFTCLY